jgi:hypothetical protein
MKSTTRATPASSTASRPEFDSRLNSYSKAALAVAAVGALTATEAAAQASGLITFQDITSSGSLTGMTNTTFSFAVGGATAQFDAKIGQIARHVLHVNASMRYAALHGLNAAIFGISFRGVRMLQASTNLNLKSADVQSNSLFYNPFQAVVGGLAAHTRNVATVNGIFHNVRTDHIVGAFAGNTGYIGFRLQNGSQTYNGWLRVGVTFAGGNPTGISLVSKDGSPDIYGAWSTGDIQVGQTDFAAIPEPASVATGLGLFALGAAGVREFRRRKQQAA